MTTLTPPLSRGAGEGDRPHAVDRAARGRARVVAPTRRWLVLALLGLALAPLAGCARKNRPTYPPGSDYPRTYPTE